MISLKELLSGNDYNSLPKDHQQNIMDLLEKINRVADLRGKIMQVSSGYRSIGHHLDIYAKKGITDPKKIPMRSQHLCGAAVDISDPNKDLQKWCTENEKQLKDIGFWMENFSATPNWCHFQIFKYGSYTEDKSIWFNP